MINSFSGSPPQNLLYISPPLKELPYSLIDGFREILGVKELERIEHASPKRQAELLAGRALLRLALSDAHGQKAPVDWCVLEREGLPPYVKNSGMYFSLSHSHDYVVLAISINGPVGVDVEFHRQRRFDALARTWYHPDEADQLTRLTEELKREYFYQVWTLKEAYIKQQMKSVFASDFQRLKVCEFDKEAIHSQNLFPGLWLRYGEYSVSVVKKDLGAVVVYTFSDWQQVIDFRPAFVASRTVTHTLIS